MAKKKAAPVDSAAQAVYEKGRAYYRAQEYERAFACFVQAAQAGDADAENFVGVCYEAGQGVARNEKEAITRYRHAAWHGNVFAQYNLGVCYAEGRGTARDEKAAFEWFRLAAQNG